MSVEKAAQLDEILGLYLFHLLIYYLKLSKRHHKKLVTYFGYQTHYLWERRWPNSRIGGNS